MFLPPKYQTTAALISALLLTACYADSTKETQGTTSPSTSAQQTQNSTPIQTPPAEKPAVDWKEQATQIVQEDVRQMTAAVYENGGNVDAIFKYTHPMMLASMDQKKMRVEVTKMLAQMKKQNVKMESIEFVGSPYFAESEKNQFAIVPTKIIISSKQGRVENTGFIFGQRARNTDKWGYLEGNKLNNQNIRELFPDFPQGSSLPSHSLRKL